MSIFCIFAVFTTSFSSYLNMIPNLYVSINCTLQYKTVLLLYNTVGCKRLLTGPNIIEMRPEVIEFDEKLNFNANVFIFIKYKNKCSGEIFIKPVNNYVCD